MANQEPTGPESTDPELTDTDAVDSDAAEDAAVDSEAAEEVAVEAELPDPGETLFHEPGGSWWVVSIGPVLILAVLIMEIMGQGRVHWPVLAIFALITVGFSVIQVVAARKHVSVTLTETWLQQGAKTIRLDEIEKIFPANNGPTHEKWESAPALGELHAVPRRRKGIGVKLRGGKLAQAWARDVEVFRAELTEAHQAVKMGLGPRGTSTD